MNVFQSTYEHRLRDWRQLREIIKPLSLEQQCVEVDRWWQLVPFVPRHLHWNDISNWPDPWTMLSENRYCLLTRAVGMCYTLLINDINEVELILVQDQQAEEHYLVIVNNYILNYWPDTVLTNKLSDFTILKRISTTLLKNKII
jgi:hypothetical protein